MNYCFTRVPQEQKSISFFKSEVVPGARVNFLKTGAESEWKKYTLHTSAVNVNVAVTFVF